MEPWLVGENGALFSTGDKPSRRAQAVNCSATIPFHQAQTRNPSAESARHGRHIQLIAAIIFGMVHGGIGALEQHMFVGAMLGEKGDADAC